eukprot:GDKI01019349.1.p1 GENE.GDKI01019349.1~~GDKI01019349.1.p1  ORF type:complete len:331 (-),score=73.86 GDKI01019349.1:256-1173(-)
MRSFSCSKMQALFLLFSLVLSASALRMRTASDGIEGTLAAAKHEGAATGPGSFLNFGDTPRVALVTGAARGIGKAIALRLLETGVNHVIIADMNGEQAEETATEFRNMGYSASSQAVDVSNAKSCKEMAERILKEHKKVDILINNAGITRDNLFIRMSEKEWDSVINVNLNSAFYVTKPLINAMMKQKWGRIVNLSSVVGIGGNAGQANYSASKAGLVGFSKSLAKEMAQRGITVNAVAPGFIATAMTDKLSDDVKESINKQVPMGRQGTAEEVADLVAFLSSEQARYITGKVIPIEGGMMFGAN